MRYDYDKDIQDNAPTGLSQSGFHHARLQAMATFACRHISQCMVWLDVGCHGGHFIALLHPIKIGRAMGGDLSLLALNLARQRQPHHHWLCMSASQLAVAKASCQVISVLEVWGILTPDQQQQAIRETSDALQSQGWLLVAIRLGQDGGQSRESRLRQALDDDFQVVDFFYYDYFYYSRFCRLVQSWGERINYYATLLFQFRHNPPLERASKFRKLLLFFSRHLPFLLLWGEMVFNGMKNRLDALLTNRWLGNKLWHRGVTMERPATSSGAIVLLCQKKEAACPSSPG